MAERFNWAQQITNHGALNSPDISTRSPDFRQATLLDYEGKARQVYLNAIDELRAPGSDMSESGVFTLATEAADYFIRETNTTHLKQAMDRSSSGQPYVTPDTTRAYRKTERDYQKRLEQLESEQERVNEASSGEEVPDIEERYSSRKQNLIYEREQRIEMNKAGYVFDVDGNTTAYPIWRKPITKEDMRSQTKNLEGLLMTAIGRGTLVKTDSEVARQMHEENEVWEFPTLAKKIMYGELALTNSNTRDTLDISFDPAYRIADSLLTAHADIYNDPKKVIMLRRLFEISPDFRTFTAVWEQLFPNIPITQRWQQAYDAEGRKNVGRQLERRLYQRYQHEKRTRKPYTVQGVTAYTEAHAQRSDLETQVHSMVTGAGTL